MIPSWLKPGFIVIHILVGAALWLVMWRLGSPPAAIFVAALAMGVAKEYGEEPSDLVGSGNGQPWNGIIDVLAFVVAPVVWWIWS